MESLFAVVRFRTDSAKQFKKVTNATAILWKMLEVAEQNFCPMKHPELVAEVCRGVKFIDGGQEKTEVAAYLTNA